jgi:FtsP/CotA-like multicopper oxidase with cupredoxin domain
MYRGLHQSPSTKRISAAMPPLSHTRREFLKRAAALGAAGLAAGPLGAQPAPRAFTLSPAPAKVALVGDPHPDTEVWAFDGRVPGPEIRVRQGERVRIAVANGLPQETTVHWHGLRVPHAMDGVPHLTQPPIAPGGRFVYEFEVPDAGTYWYHPHAQSYEQVARGLYGALVVEERERPDVDRDVTWVLSDWRLGRDAQLRTDFRAMFDVAHAGRIGNTVTVNGVVAESFDVRAGERIRLRLVNTAVARIYALRFDGHAPVVASYDGQPVAPHAPPDGRVVLGPGERVDLVIDMTGAPGARFGVSDDFYPRNAYRLLDLAYSQERPLRDRERPAWTKLPANPLREPDLSRAVRHEIALTGGAMGGMGGGGMGGMMGRGMAWMINGNAVGESDHHHAPLFALARDQSCVVTFVNDTAWHHPMHLHGHFFRVLSRDGAPTPHREWRDTVLLPPRSRAEVAFVGDNPGDWMLHCHVLDHQAGGMMATIRVG